MSSAELRNRKTLTSSSSSSTSSPSQSSQSPTAESPVNPPPRQTPSPSQQGLNDQLAISLLELDFAYIPLLVAVYYAVFYTADRLWTAYSTDALPETFGLLWSQIGPGSGLLLAVLINLHAQAFIIVFTPLLRRIPLARLRMFVYIIFQAALVAIPPLTLWSINPTYSVVAGASVSVQITIYSMKTHSMFFYDGPNASVTIPRALKFTFLPSMVYHDDFFISQSPFARATKTPFNWNSCLKHGLLAFGSFGVIEMLWHGSVMPVVLQYKTLGFWHSWLKLCPAGFALYYTAFFGIFHATQNFLAEIWGHNNRNFYEDWWAATDFGVWTRKWNLTVQAWIASIYIPMRHNLGLPRNVAQYAALMVSAIWHEYIILVSSRQLSFWTVGFMSGLYIVTALAKWKYTKAIAGTNAFVQFGIFVGFAVLVMLNCVCYLYVDCPVCLPHNIIKLSFQ